VFQNKDIKATIEKGRKYNPDVIGSSQIISKSMGIDPAYGICPRLTPPAVQTLCNGYYI
jgi:hypothetical protein